MGAIQFNILTGKYLYFGWNVTYFFSYGSNWQYVIIGSNTDLAPNWWQAPAWSNDDQNFVTFIGHYVSVS